MAFNVVTLSGVFGTVMLLLAYVVVISDKTVKYFIPVNIVASLSLTLHAILIKDLPFTLTNGFITSVLVWKWVRKEKIL